MCAKTRNSENNIFMCSVFCIYGNFSSYGEKRILHERCKCWKVVVRSVAGFTQFIIAAWKVFIALCIAIPALLYTFLATHITATSVLLASYFTRKNECLLPSWYSVSVITFFPLIFLEQFRICFFVFKYFLLSWISWRNPVHSLRFTYEFLKCFI